MTRLTALLGQVGCGKTYLASGDRAPAAGECSLAALLGQLAAVRASLDVPRVHLLGHGWGAALALEHVLAGGGAGIASLTLASAAPSAAQLAADRRERVRLPGPTTRPTPPCHNPL